MFLLVGLLVRLESAAIVALVSGQGVVDVARDVRYVTQTFSDIEELVLARPSRDRSATPIAVGGIRQLLAKRDLTALEEVCLATLVDLT